MKTLQVVSFLIVVYLCFGLIGKFFTSSASLMWEVLIPFHLLYLVIGAAVFSFCESKKPNDNIAVWLLIHMISVAATWIVVAVCVSILKNALYPVGMYEIDWMNRSQLINLPGSVLPLMFIGGIFGAGLSFFVAGVLVEIPIMVGLLKVVSIGMVYFIAIKIALFFLPESAIYWDVLIPFHTFYIVMGILYFAFDKSGEFWIWLLLHSVTVACSFLLILTVLYILHAINSHNLLISEISVNWLDRTQVLSFPGARVQMIVLGLFFGFISGLLTLIFCTKETGV